MYLIKFGDLVMKSLAGFHRCHSLQGWAGRYVKVSKTVALATILKLLLPARISDRLVTCGAIPPTMDEYMRAHANMPIRKSAIDMRLLPLLKRNRKLALNDFPM